MYFNKLLSDLDGLENVIDRFIFVDNDKIESGVLFSFTMMSWPGKYFGREIEFAKLVVTGNFMPHSEGRNLSKFIPELRLRLSVDLLLPKRDWRT